jgi:glycerate kinase
MTQHNRLKVIVCPDSFKGSLSSSEAADAIERGILASTPSFPVEVVKVPLADGGEGTAEVLLQALGGRFVEIDVHDPLMRPIRASYALSADRKTAIVEMATASGLCLLKENERDPRITTTFGTGELISAALRSGVERILVCIGGSATNDGGSGVASTLGVRFLDASGKELPYGGASLAGLDRIDMSGFIFPAGDVAVTVACDVTNPLTGPNGASAIYGPQKGADPQMVSELDAALTRYGRIVEDQLGVSVVNMPGAGAAGGLGAGLAAFLKAELRSGIDMVLDAVGFDEMLSHADLVITGEGCIDSQTASGKVIGGILNRAQRLHVPVIAFGGKVEVVPELYESGLTAAFPIASGPMSHCDSISSAKQLLESASERVFRLSSVFLKKNKCSGNDAGSQTSSINNG